MKVLHSGGIFVAYLLVSQCFVHATIEIIDSFGTAVDNFPNRDATPNEHTMEGYIEYAEPSDACSKIGTPNFPQNYTMKKIVLINGTSTCGFMTKVQNAKAAGYDIAVLCDPLPGPFDYPNITFPLLQPEVNISLVLVLFEDGIVIRNNYLFHVGDKENFIIRINENSPYWHIIGTYIFFGCVLSLMLFIICSLFIYFVQWVWNSCLHLFGKQNDIPNGDLDPDGGGDNPNDDRDPDGGGDNPNDDRDPDGGGDNPNDDRDGDHNADDNRNGDPGLRRSPLVDVTDLGITEERRKKFALVNNLKRRYPSDTISKDDNLDECSICCRHFKMDQWFRKLGCSHVFHAHCIDKWLLCASKNQTCPLCVRKVYLKNSPPTENTPLITSSHGQYSSFRANDDSGPSHDAAYDNPVLLTDDSVDLLPGAQGSVNSVSI